MAKRTKELGLGRGLNALLGDGAAAALQTANWPAWRRCRQSSSRRMTAK